MLPKWQKHWILRILDYNLEEFEHKHSHEKELVCTCRLFTDENIGFVDAYTYFKVQGIDIDKLIQPILRCRINCQKYTERKHTPI